MNRTARSWPGQHGSISIGHIPVRILFLVPYLKHNLQHCRGNFSNTSSSASRGNKRYLKQGEGGRGEVLK